VTGSGKTAAFALPLLERLLFRSRRVRATYVLVLTPTRELAVQARTFPGNGAGRKRCHGGASRPAGAQVHGMTAKLAQFTDVRVALVVGGLSLQVQAATLRTQPEVVVATPARPPACTPPGLHPMHALAITRARHKLKGFTGVGGGGYVMP
jgi:ATP-dependent RNA helicase DDX27